MAKEFKSETKLRYGKSGTGPERKPINPLVRLTGADDVYATDDMPISTSLINELVRRASVISTRTQASSAVASSISNKAAISMGGSAQVVGSFSQSAPTGVNINKEKYPEYNEKPYFEAVAEYYNGDHWQAGKAWRGPLPMNFEATADAAAASAQVMSLIEAASVTRNYVKECTDRHVKDVIGIPPLTLVVDHNSVNHPQIQDMPELDPEADTIRPPSILPELSNAGKDSSLVASIDFALKRFARLSNTHKHWKQATTEACLFETAFVRFFRVGDLGVEVPLTESDVTDISGRELFNISLKNWRMHAIDPRKERCAVYVDAADVPVLAFYEKDMPFGVYQELQYVDQSDITRVLFRSVENSEDEVTPFILNSFNLGGQLLIHKMSRDTIVSPQVLQNNDMLNVVYTILGRSNIQAGFLERVLLNAQIAVETKTITHGDGTTTKTVVPKPMGGGHGQMMVAQGVPFVDPDTQSVTGMTNPQMLWKDPVTVAHYVGSRDIYLQNIYGEMGQMAVLIQNSATTSGYSKENSQHDSINFMQDTIEMVSRALNWSDEVITGILSSAVDMDTVEIYTHPITIDKVPTTEDKRVARELFDGGVWSLEQAHSETGVINSAMQKRKILEERAQGLGNSSFESRRVSAETASMNAQVQLTARTQAAQQAGQDNSAGPRSQANNFSQSKTGQGKGGNQIDGNGIVSNVKDGANARKPVSPGTSTPNAGRPQKRTSDG